MRVVSSTVYLSIAFQPTSVGTRWRDCAACFGIELRRLVVQDLLEIPDHDGGVEVGAVMELHALAQLEDPALAVALDRRPFGGETRLDVGEHVGLGEVPVHQRVVDRVAREAETFEALVGLAGGLRDVGRCHADAQMCPVKGQALQKPREGRSRRQQGEGA